MAGYVGLELAQAYRRFGSRVTVIEKGAANHEPRQLDIGESMHGILSEEGIRFVLSAEPVAVQADPAKASASPCDTPAGMIQTIEASALVRSGAFRTPPASAWRRWASVWMRAAIIRVNERLETTAP